MKEVVEKIRLKVRASRLLAQAANLLTLHVPSKTFWTWEVYGLGHSRKDIQSIPQRKILRSGSDHGVALEVEPLEAEEAIPAKVHFTWSIWRTNLRFSDGRQVVRIQHPWIAFREKHGLKPRETVSGTLVFVPHGNPGFESDYFDIVEYVKFLSLLPREFHPLVFCLHAHDVQEKYAREIHKLGFSVVTVGSSLHPRYVRRFYGILKNFKYATSTRIGSQLFYCHEFGVKFFLLDQDQKFRRYFQVLVGRQYHNEVIERIEQSFGFENLAAHPFAKDSIVSDALGLDLAN
jgi:hypothetical protein